jgi:hypothetical protein
MNAPDITDIELPNLHLPSLATIAELVSLDEIVDLADSAAARVRRLWPWSQATNRRRNALFGVGIVAALLLVGALVRRSRRTEPEVRSDDARPTPIHNAA